MDSTSEEAVDAMSMSSEVALVVALEVRQNMVSIVKNRADDEEVEE